MLHRLAYRRPARARANAQAQQLTKAGCRKVFRDVHVSGAKADRAQLRRVIETLGSGDVPGDPEALVPDRRKREHISIVIAINQLGSRDKPPEDDLSARPRPVFLSVFRSKQSV